MTARAWFRVHSFTGVVSGLLLFVVCWSGTFAVVAHEIDWLVTPEARVERGAGFVGWDALREAAQTALPDGQILWIEAPKHPWAAAQAVVDTPAQPSLRVYVDPYDGDVQGVGSYLTVQRFFRSLHMELFDVGGFGDYLVLLTVFPLIASAWSALAFWRRWRRGFLVAPRGRGRAWWSGLHRLVGLWSLAFVAVIAVTSVWYLFETLRIDVGDGRSSWSEADPHHGTAPEAADAEGFAVPPFALLVEHAAGLRPDLDVRTVLIDPGRLTFEGQAGHWLVRDRANQIQIDRVTGAVLHDQRASDLPAYWRWSDTADPLHFGDFGGLVSKLVWFAFGLALSGLILTGAWLHACRLAPAGGRRTRWAWRSETAALAATLLLFAAAVPAGLAEARDYYGPVAPNGGRLPALPFGVRAAIFGWIALTVAILAAWLAVALSRPGAGEVLIDAT